MLFSICRGKSAVQEGIYRLIENERVDALAIEEGTCKRFLKNAEKHSRVLVIQDTITLSFNHSLREELSDVGAPRTKGLLVHSALLVEPEKGDVLGLGAQKWWVRPKDRSDSFEVYLPESWKERCQHNPELSSRHINVFLPCPEDLAVMKVFRFNTKDQMDIERLASLHSFDLQLFRTSFLDTLPFAIGDLRHHAQSFMFVWNALVHDDILTIEQVLESAGISPK